MAVFHDNYPEKVYAGWLGKTVGIRLGAPIESMLHEKIMSTFGNIDGYLIDYDRFAADDDSNGPIYLVRALEDSGKGKDMTSQDVAEALLNYAPYEHGFFWWGGYGISTEHTAYLNLRRGIPAPDSGSIATNGSTVAEQIGGQIFSDCWGLVCPGDAKAAAALAEKASRVSHDGNAMYGGRFVAAAISLAFTETDIETIVEKALLQIPQDSEYCRVSRDVIDFYHSHPDDWQACFAFIKANYGYDKYPGACHVIPNAAVMILSMLYGGGSFDRTIEICCMCGWDTDCNAGNVGTVLGVLCGLEGISYPKWRKPINDFLALSGVMGSMNLSDVAAGASYMAKLGYEIAAEPIPEKWRDALERCDDCLFAYPGSTQAMLVRCNEHEAYPYKAHSSLINTDEAALSCGRALKLFCCRVTGGQTVDMYKRSYLAPEDFADSRYDPAFSPLLYPGDRLSGAVMVPDYAISCCKASLYVKYRSGDVTVSPAVCCERGRWYELVLDIPESAELILEAGFRFTVEGDNSDKCELCVIADNLSFGANPRYTVDMGNECVHYWKPTHREISQFTQLKGKAKLENGSMLLSSDDFEEVYTGSPKWTDYTVSAELCPKNSGSQMLLARVQGAMRSYGFGFAGGKLALVKNARGRKVLAECDFESSFDEYYTLSIKASGSSLSCYVNGKLCIEYTDENKPHLNGAVGIGVYDGGSCEIKRIKLN